MNAMPLDRPLRKTLVFLSLVLLMFSLGGRAHAQPVLDQEFVQVPIDQFSAGLGTPGLYRAQTFTVGVSGTLTSFEIFGWNHPSNPSATHPFEIWSTVSGAPEPVPGTPLASVLVALPLSTADWASADVSAFNLVVNVGDVLAIVSPPSADLAIWEGNFAGAATYAGGEAYTTRLGDLTWRTDFSALVTFGDFAFRTCVLPEGEPPGISIKPGSDPAAINPFSHGVIPVALLGSDCFDVLEVDETTLAFGPAGAALGHATVPHHADVNDDGFTDLVAHFAVKETGIAFGDTEACLTGEIDGMPFEACDDIKTVPACGIGFELALLLPPLMWVYGRRRRLIH
jgi:hypothetical protein